MGTLLFWINIVFVSILRAANCLRWRGARKMTEVQKDLYSIKGNIIPLKILKKE
jgi:hypothetical protein